MRTAQKTIKPEATLEWGRGGCVGPKKTGPSLALRMSYLFRQGERMVVNETPDFTHKKVTNKNMICRKKAECYSGPVENSDKQ